MQFLDRMSHIEYTVLNNFHKLFDILIFFLAWLGDLFESPHSNHRTYLALDGKSRDTPFLDSFAGPNVPPSEVFLDSRRGLGASSQLSLGLQSGDSDSL